MQIQRFLRWLRNATDSSKSDLSLFGLALLFGAFIYADLSVAQDVEPSSWRLSTETRMRLQSVSRSDQADGEALTLRGRGALEADLVKGLVFLGEVEGTVQLAGDFNDGRGDRSLPFIPDPEGLELNRFQLQAERDTVRVTAGRQRIALDDWRFIGAFPFRQNDQTFDAVRLEVRDFGPGILDAGYFRQAHRPLGEDNPVGRFEGDSFFANYNTPTPLGRLTLFHYQLDLHTAPLEPGSDAFSNRVTGARLFGRRDGELSTAWEFSYAQQQDYADNPRQFSVDYWLTDFSLGWAGTKVGFRAETLGTDRGIGFQTPLASLHKFQGLADQFLITPPDGVRDLSVTLSRDFAPIGSLKGIRTFIRYHDFASANGDQQYGSEWDFSISAKLASDKRIGFEYAAYNADEHSTDTQVLSISMDWDF